MQLRAPIRPMAYIPEVKQQLMTQHLMLWLALIMRMDYMFRPEN